MKRKIFSILLAICMLLPQVALAAEKKPYQQNLWGHWTDVMYDGWTFGNTGCGIMAMVNAVNYATGNFIDPIVMADWAHAIGAYNGNDGTYREILYSRVEAQFGAQYNFKVDNTGVWGSVRDTLLQNHLINGGVAVANVYNHFIALVAYNPEARAYLVYDSAFVNTNRPTTQYGDWLSIEDLDGNYWAMDVYWYCLISSTDKTEPVISNPRVVNVNDEGYTVAMEVTDNTNIYEVYCPTWTEPGSQDDLVWHKATISESTAYCVIPKSEHNNETSDYTTHIYCYDGSNNVTKLELPPINLTDKKVGERSLADGYYYISSKLDDTKVFSVAGSSSENRANLELQTNAQLDSQLFQVIYNEVDGTYEIVNKGSGKALDVEGASYDVGSNLAQYDRNQTVAQKWILLPTEDGYYKIASNISGLVIDAAGAEAKNGTNLFMIHDNGGDNQIWAFTPYGNQVIYNGNGVVLEKTNDVFETNENIIVSDMTPKRPGFSFKGWAESADATEAKWQGGNTIPSVKSITLYAVWQPITEIIGAIEKTELGTTCNLNFYHIPENAPVFIAQYDSDGRMIGLNRQTEDQKDSLTMDVLQSTTRVTAFAWQTMGNIKPLAVPADLTIQ